MRHFTVVNADFGLYQCTQLDASDEVEVKCFDGRGNMAWIETYPTLRDAMCAISDQMQIDFNELDS